MGFHFGPDGFASVRSALRRVAADRSVSQGQVRRDQGRFGQFRPTQVRLGQGRFGQVSAAKREPGEVLPRHHDTLEVHHVQRLL